MLQLNSTHASWLNLAIAILAAVSPVLAGVPGVPAAAVTAIAALNAALHILLPDAPKV